MALCQLLLTTMKRAVTQYEGQSLIGDIAYLDKAIFNNWSRLDTIVCDQTFSQLIFPVEGLPIQDVTNDHELIDQFIQLSTKRALLFSSKLWSEARVYISRCITGRICFEYGSKTD